MSIRRPVLILLSLVPLLLTPLSVLAVPSPDGGSAATVDAATLPTITETEAIAKMVAMLQAEPSYGSDHWLSGTAAMAALTHQYHIRDDGPARVVGPSSRATYNGAHLVFNDDQANPVPSAQLRQDSMDAFDNQIYPTNTGFFGSTYDPINYRVANVDGVGGVGGFFSPAVPTRITIDTADLGIWGDEIAAHEFYHLIQCDYDCDEDLWMNEGMSDMAILLNMPFQDSIGLAGHVQDYQVNTWRSLTTFNNAGHDYGGSFTFMQYLKEHYGGQGYIEPLVQRQSNGLGSISSQLSTNGYPIDSTGIYKDWVLATLLDDTSIGDGLWGYDTFDITPSVSQVASYPYDANTNVEDYGARYYKYVGGTGDTLRVSVDTGGLFIGQVLTITGSDDPVRTEMTEPFFEVPDFGGVGGPTTVYLALGSLSDISYTLSASIIDLTPPVSTISLSPAAPDDGLWYTVSPTVTLETVDPTATISFRWDDGIDAPYVGPASVAVPQGEHTIYFHAVDFAGNIEVEQSVDLKVDSAAPVTTLVLDPSEGEVGEWYTTAPTYSFTFDKPTRIDETYHTVDGSEAMTGAGPFTLGEGVHTLTYWSVGSTQQRKESAQEATVKVDLDAPAVNATFLPPLPDGADGWYVSKPTITLEATNEPQPAELFYRTDGGLWLPYSAPIVLGHGRATLEFYGKDVVGHESAVESVEVRVDLLVPSCLVELSPEDPDGGNGWYVNAPEVLFELPDDPSAVVWYQWGEEEPLSSVDVPPEVPQGDSMLRYWAVDEAGNTELRHELEVLLDSTVPGANATLSAEPNEGGWLTKDTTITLSTDEVGASLLYIWDREPEAAYSTPLEVPEGPHTLTFYAIDAAGNSGEHTKLAVQLDTEAPKVKVVAQPTSTSVGGRVSISLDGSKDDQKIVSYIIDYDDGSDPETTTRTLSSHTFHKPGTFAVKVTALDAAGNSASGTAKVRVTAPLLATPFAPQQEGRGGFGGSLGVMALLAIVALCVIAAVLMRRRRAAQRAGVEPAPRMSQLGGSDGMGMAPVGSLAPTGAAPQWSQPQNVQSLGSAAPYQPTGPSDPWQANSVPPAGPTTAPSSPPQPPSVTAPAAEAVPPPDDGWYVAESSPTPVPTAPAAQEAQGGDDVIDSVLRKLQQ